MERRYHEPLYPGEPITVPCRHCATLNVVDADRIEVTDGRAWQKCTSCEDWFLVRWADAVALGVVRPVEIDDSTTDTH